MPILPSGPHEAHSLIHIIQEQPSQKCFRGRDILISAVIKQFPVVFTEWLQAASTAIPLPAPKLFKGCFFTFFNGFFSGLTVTSKERRNLAKKAQPKPVAKGVCAAGSAGVQCHITLICPNRTKK